VKCGEDRSYCACGNLLAMDAEGAQMTHPKRPRDPDHVGGALLAFRASGHVYLPSAIAL
jgi:hypothetical protein